MTACLSAPLESAQLSIVKCTGNAAPACSYQRCRNCCVARGAGRLGLNPCSHSLHRIHNGNASYFQGNPAPLTDAGIHELPIASPTSGDLTRPASVAWIEYCGVGWEDHNAVLKADAEARMLTEGFTINVFIWTEVRDEGSGALVAMLTLSHRSAPNPRRICVSYATVGTGRLEGTPRSGNSSRHPLPKAKSWSTTQ